MTYIKIKWLHNFKHEPVWLYSELDANRNELRKVEIFFDQSFGYACNEQSSGTTQLSELPLPQVAEIASDSQFEVKNIAKAEFELIWEQATL